MRKATNVRARPVRFTSARYSTDTSWMDTYFSIHQPRVGGRHPRAIMRGRARRTLASLCVGLVAAAVALLELGPTNPLLIPLGLAMIALAVAIDRGELPAIARRHRGAPGEEPGSVIGSRRFEGGRTSRRVSPCGSRENGAKGSGAGMMRRDGPGYT